MIESLYIVDSSGLCLFSSPLFGVKPLEPNLICGFIVAQYQYFRDAYGEEAKKFSLEKKEIMIQTVELKGQTIIIAISYAVGNDKEEKFSTTILGNLAKELKTKEKIFAGIAQGVSKTLEEEIKEIVDKVMKSTSCLYLVRGFLGLADHCDKVDAPTGGRPCDFGYAAKDCEYYSPKSN